MLRQISGIQYLFERKEELLFHEQLQESQVAVRSSKKAPLKM